MVGGQGVTCRYCCDNNLPRPVELFPAPSIFLMLVHAFSVSYSFISQTCLEHLLYSITVLEMKTAKIAKPAYNPLCYFQPVESGPRDFKQNLIISIIRAIKIQDYGPKQRAVGTQLRRGHLCFMVFQKRPPRAGSHRKMQNEPSLKRDSRMFPEKNTVCSKAWRRESV